MSRSSRIREWIGFAAVGAANTIATYLVYLAILPMAGYVVAYTVSYVAGIGFSYVANSRFVFRARMGGRSLALYPLAYIAQYLAGLGLVALQVELLGVPAWLAPWLAVVVLLPAGFVATRFILRNHAARDHQ